MSGWTPHPADGWLEVVEILTSSGRPWPECSVVHDLRWQVTQTGRIVSRRRLQKRWNWSDYAVRKMLRETPRWVDPGRPEVYAAWCAKSHDQPNVDPAPPQHHPNVDPSTTQLRLVEAGESREILPAPPQHHPNVDPASPHGDPQARCREQEQEHQQEQEQPVYSGSTQQPALPGLPAPPPERPADVMADEVDKVLDFWGTEVNEALGRRRTGRGSYGRRTKSALRALIANEDIGLERIMGAMHYLAKAESASWWRDKATSGDAAWLTLDWLITKRCGDICAWSDAWAVERGKVEAAEEAARKRQELIDTKEERMALMRENLIEQRRQRAEEAKRKKEEQREWDARFGHLDKRNRRR